MTELRGNQGELCKLSSPKPSAPDLSNVFEEIHLYRGWGTSKQEEYASRFRTHLHTGGQDEKLGEATFLRFKAENNSYEQQLETPNPLFPDGKDAIFRKTTGVLGPIEHELSSHDISQARREELERKMPILLKDIASSGYDQNGTSLETWYVNGKELNQVRSVLDIIAPQFELAPECGK